MKKLFNQSILTAFTLAVEYQRSGKLKKAEDLYLQILKQDTLNFVHSRVGLAPPIKAAVYSNLGAVLMEQGMFEAAHRHYNKALNLKPNSAKIYNNIGLNFMQQCEFVKSCIYYKKALNLVPDYAEAHSNLAGALTKIGELNRAVKHYRTAINLKPDYLKAQSDLLFCLNYTLYGTEKIYNEHKLWGKSQDYLCCNIFNANTPDPERPIRIGYVSPDFRRHPVAFFFEPILENHDPEKIETVSYSDAAYPDNVTKRLESLSNLWINTCGMTDKQLADRIQYDGIDILVDLAGHTAKNRLLVFARKPAPIQVTYLGYPNTTGLSAIDYRITDSYADPPGKIEKYHTEKLIRLSGSFFCYRPPDEDISVSSLPAFKKGCITFGSFQNFAKCSNILDLWIKILQKLPNSRFIIQSEPFKDKNISLKFKEFFAQKGISKQRIELAAYSSFYDYLKFHNKIDIILDTFPWNGHTTSCHALWMGIPVITLAGKHHASRLGLSLLSGTGLTDLIANTPKEYINKALNLADNLDNLASIRHKLRCHIISSDLCNGKKFTSNLEAVYRKMWKQWCRNH
ncbi:protein O-GlcNAc transferase [Candidatus Magnetomoraceae bacterium gMMP-15]